MKITGSARHATCEGKCFRLSKMVRTSRSSEQTSRKLTPVLYAQLAAEIHRSFVRFQTTLVVIISLSLSSSIGCNLIIRRVTNSRRKIIDYTTWYFALPGLQPWTGCNSASAITRQREIEDFKACESESEAQRSIYLSWCYMGHATGIVCSNVHNYASRCSVQKGKQRNWAATTSSVVIWHNGICRV